MAIIKLSEREQEYVKWSQDDFNTYMRECCEDDRVIPFWAFFTECEMKHFSKIILDVDDLDEDEILECLNSKIVKKAETDLTKLHKKLIEDNKSDLSKLTDLVIVYNRKGQQHDCLDNGIQDLRGFYLNLIDDVAEFVSQHLEDYNDDDIDRFESISCIDVRE